VLLLHLNINDAGHSRRGPRRCLFLVGPFIGKHQAISIQRHNAVFCLPWVGILCQFHLVKHTRSRRRGATRRGFTADVKSWPLRKATQQQCFHSGFFYQHPRSNVASSSVTMHSSPTQVEQAQNWAHAPGSEGGAVYYRKTFIDILFKLEKKRISTLRTYRRCILYGLYSDIKRDSDDKSKVQSPNVGTML